MQGTGEGLGRATPGVKGPAGMRTLRDVPPPRGDAAQRDQPHGAHPGGFLQQTSAQRSSLGSSRAGAAAEPLPRGLLDQE